MGALRRRRDEWTLPLFSGPWALPEAPVVSSRAKAAAVRGAASSKPRRGGGGGQRCSKPNTWGERVRFVRRDLAESIGGRKRQASPRGRRRYQNQVDPLILEDEEVLDIAQVAHAALVAFWALLDEELVEWEDLTHNDRDAETYMVMSVVQDPGAEPAELYPRWREYVTETASEHSPRPPVTIEAAAKWEELSCDAQKAASLYRMVVLALASEQ